MPTDPMERYADQACQLLGNRWSVVRRVGSGNSATVFELHSHEGTAALKIYDPKFFEGANAAVEERRILDQMSLRHHGHPSLIDFIDAGQVTDTYYLLMEYYPWRSLDQCLDNIRTSDISNILSQVASAAQFLEQRNFVHRDIKPANILISDDCQLVKLLDLGVMRPLATEQDRDNTDQGYSLPFVATAQYSSPAYLIRDGDPTESMWRALTFYQLGGVLHDMLMKRPLFNEEVRTGNRYRVAAAVLLKAPEIYAPDAPAWLLSLARTCLVKDDDRRLARVYWARFNPDQSTDLQDLRNRLGLVPPNHAFRDDKNVDQQRQERIGLLLDQGSDHLVEIGRHVLLSQGFPRAGMKKQGESPSLRRSVIFSFSPQFAAKTKVTLHFAVSLCLQCESNDQLDVFLASFVTANHGDIPDEFSGEFLWTTSFNSLKLEDEQLVEILTSEFIRRYAAAEDQLQAMLDARELVLQFTHGCT